jgi:Flp pilus assembly protein TadB
MAKTYASPLSFTGATRRIVSKLRQVTPQIPVVRQIVLVVTATLSLVVVYLFLLVYTVVVLGLFGLLVIPFRAHRRGQRRQEELLRQIAEKPN